MSFNHDAHQVFLDDFGFDAGDRFTYTYNFIDHWLCDVRIEGVKKSVQRTPWCHSGSGRQGDECKRYYKIDEHFALVDIVAKAVTAKDNSPVSTLHPLLERYEDIRFSRVLINKQLKKAFHT